MHKSVIKHLWYCKIILSMCLHKARHSFCVPLVSGLRFGVRVNEWLSCVSKLSSSALPSSCCAICFPRSLSVSGVMHLLPGPGLARALRLFHASLLEGACSVITCSPSVFLAISDIQGKRQCKTHFEEHIMRKKTYFSLEGLCRRLIPSQLDDVHRENVKAAYLKEWDLYLDYYTNICH